MTITLDRDSVKARAAFYLRTRGVTAEQAPYSHLQSATGTFDPERAVHSEDDWCVYLDSGLDRWFVYTDTVNKRVFVSPSTWQTLQHSGRALLHFTTEFIPQDGQEVMAGMKFVVADVGPYAEAARAEARAAGTDVPAVKDRLTQLIEQANHFIVQAASINDRPTPGQAQMFAVRYATMSQQLADLQQELAHADSLLRLAGTALVDATS